MIDLPAEFFHGIELFNEMEFFECHEVLEDVWRKQVDPERQLTQGIIQVSVAFYHAYRNNFAGAIKLLTAGETRIKAAKDLAVPLDLAALLASVTQALDSVQNNQLPKTFEISCLPDKT